MSLVIVDPVKNTSAATDVSPEPVMRESKRLEVTVAAGVLRDSLGRVLITQRPAEKHVGGYWEFPGGKLRTGESARAALDRELGEELGIRVLAATPLIGYRHEYPDRDVILRVFEVAKFSGEPVGREGQPLRWLDWNQLRNFAALLPADVPIIKALASKAAAQN